MEYIKLWMWISIALLSALVMFLHRVLGWGFVPTLVSAILLNLLLMTIAWIHWRNQEH